MPDEDMSWPVYSSSLPMHKTPLNNIKGSSFDKSAESQMGTETPANK